MITYALLIMVGLALDMGTVFWIILVIGAVLKVIGFIAEVIAKVAKKLLDD